MTPFTMYTPYGEDPVRSSTAGVLIPTGRAKYKEYHLAITKCMELATALHNPNPRER